MKIQKNYYYLKNLKRISNILFLGYSSNETSLIEHLKNLGYDVTFENTKLENTALKKYDFVISYGYRHILTKEHLSNSKQPPINLISLTYHTTEARTQTFGLII